jgi:putative membrane protein
MKTYQISSTTSTIGVLAAAAVFCCASAFGQARQTSMPDQPAANQMQAQGMNNPNTVNGQASPADLEFVKNALQGSMAEVQTAQIALQKSNNDQVKQFAQRMVTDHSKMIDQMKPIAMKLGVKIPNGPDKKDKAEMAKLQALSGPDFDRAYVKDMLKDHKTDDSDFKMEISSGQSEVVRDAASKGDPVIESHLQQIQGIAKDMNLNNGM